MTHVDTRGYYLVVIEYGGGKGQQYIMMSQWHFEIRYTRYVSSCCNAVPYTKSKPLLNWDLFSVCICDVILDLSAP